MGFTCDGTKSSNSHIDKVNLFLPLILALANYKLGITFNQDQQILSALLSSMTEDVLGDVLPATSSKEAWDILSNMFSSVSQRGVV
jgi:hypothetical protein